jgi:hypothetical protein
MLMFQILNAERGTRSASGIVNLENLVAIMVDDLDGDFAGGGWIKRSAFCRVEGGPGRLVNFGLEGPL